MGKWACGYCLFHPSDKYLFASKQALVRHRESFHKKRYDCPVCKERFSNKYTAARHFKEYHKEKSLPKEMKQQRAVTSRQVETIRHHQAFDLSADFDDISPPSSTCPFCREVFRSPYLLRDHWRRDHPKETGHKVLVNRSTADRLKIIRNNLQHHPERFILPLTKESTQENEKFKLSQTTFRMAFNEVGIEAVKMGYGSELVNGVFTYVVEEIRKQCKTEERSFIGFNITADCLDTPLTVPFTQAKDFSADQLLEAIYALGTSDKYIEADDNLAIRLDMLNLKPPEHMTFGAMKPVKSYHSKSMSRLEALARKQGLYGFANVVMPFDCALVAFVLSQRMRELGTKYRRNHMFRNVNLINFEKSPSEMSKIKRSKHKSELRRRIHELINHFAPDFSFIRPQGREFLIRLQKHMEVCVKPAQQLVVFKDGEWEEPVFAGPLRPIKDRVYFLYLENKHICLMGKPETFFGGRLYDCCLAVSKRETTHRCGIEGQRRFCVKCAQDCWESYPAAPDCVCEDCNTYFDRRNCYFMHTYRLSGRPSRCETHATCLGCLSIRERSSIGSQELKPHDCMMYTCRHCKESFKADGLNPHFCEYQSPEAPLLGGGDKAFFRVYFDMETCLRGEDNRLVAYLTTAIFVCSKCVQDIAEPSRWKPSYRCCGIRKRSYWFEEGMRSFLRDAFGGRKDIKRGIGLAYNMRSFDGYFLLRHILAAGSSPKNVTVAGNRLMSIKFNDVQVKDMNLYLSGSLASLPSSFGIAELVKKGNFPHLFANTLSFDEMKTYRSPNHPPLEMYSARTQKSQKAQEALAEWHASVADTEFNFKQEAEHYCFNDSLILAICSEKLDGIIRDFTNNDISLLNSATFTLASLTMTIFRHQFMKVPIGVVPQTGYTPGKHSVIANLWFMYLNKRRERTRRPKIRFALNNCGGEFRIDRMRVDGTCEKTGTMFEFHGCYWHGCSKCFDNSKDIHPTYKIPFYAVRNRDLRRIKKFLSLTFTVQNHQFGAS